MKKGAYYITSGILDVKEEVVVEAVKDSRPDACRSDTSGRVGLRNSKKGLILMQRFFVEPHQIDEGSTPVSTSHGTDVNHIANVLRMKQWRGCCGSATEANKEYRCTIEELGEDEVLLHILYAQEPEYELPNKIYLFPGTAESRQDGTDHPESSRAGSLFVVIPVETKRCVVKLDGKKAAKKVVRWQQIAESAAKQSKRMLIPEIHEVMTYKQALEFAKQLDVKLIPYELAKGMKETREILSEIKPGQSVGIFIGPEGGFEEEEVAKALEAGAHAITLGRRILRTETAGLAILSVLMFQLENE